MVMLILCIINFDFDSDCDDGGDNSDYDDYDDDNSSDVTVASANSTGAVPQAASKSIGQHPSRLVRTCGEPKGL